MTLSPREELHQLIDKLPESKVEELLDIAKDESKSEPFISDNLLSEIEIIFKEDANLLNRLAQ